MQEDSVEAYLLDEATAFSLMPELGSQDARKRWPIVELCAFWQQGLVPTSGSFHAYRALPLRVTAYFTESPIQNAFAFQDGGDSVILLEPMWLWEIRRLVAKRLYATEDPLWAGLEETDFDFDLWRKKYRDSGLAVYVADTVHTLILAHELGHHVFAHLSKRSDVGSSPEQELEADAFAGYILGRNHAERQLSKNYVSPTVQAVLQEQPSRVALEVWGVLYGEKDTTHPSFAKRTSAVSGGFELGLSVGKGLGGDDLKLLAEASAHKAQIELLVQQAYSGTRKKVTLLSKPLLAAEAPRK